MTLSPGPSPRHFRALARRSVSLSAMLRPKAGTPIEPAWLVDLGLGGAGAQVAEIIPVGTAVSVSLSARRSCASSRVRSASSTVRKSLTPN